MKNFTKLTTNELKTVKGGLVLEHVTVIGLHDIKAGPSSGTKS